MATRLGSVITFDSQKASVSGFDSIRIIAQNFGFDLNNHITEVELDLNEPHYYMEVMKKH